MNDYKLHHIGVTVTSLKETISFLEKFGFVLEKVVRNEERGLTLAFLMSNDFRIELYSWDKPQQEHDIFHEPGYHHLAFKVDNIDNVVKDLELLSKNFSIKTIIQPKKVIHKNTQTNTYEEKRILFIKFNDEIIFEFYE